MKFTSIHLLRFLVAFAVSPCAALAVASPTHGKACFTVDEEANLRNVEAQQLGQRHADEHARSRKAKCEVEKGLRAVPDKGTPAKKGEDALREEKDEKEKIVRAAPPAASQAGR